MKKKVLFFSYVFIFLFFMVLSSSGKVIKFDNNWGKQGFNLVSSTKEGMEIIYLLHQIRLEKHEVGGEDMYKVSIPGTWLPNDEGAPNLPGMGRYIASPQGASVCIKIVSYRKEVIEDISIAPAPNIPFEIDDSPLIYKKDKKIYDVDAYYPSEPVRVSEPKKMRGVDVVILGITPFQYNPVTRELIIYKDIRVLVSFEGGSGHFGDDRLRSRWFEPILYGNLLNYNSLPSISSIEFSRETDTRAGECEYIIIVPDDPDFIAWADTIKYWRKKQGILTDVYKITDPEIGSNTVAAIENFINTAYNTWSIPPVAVLLLSDYESSGEAYGITSPIYPHPYAGSPDYVTDNTYADVDGDGLPEMNFARITAQDNADLKEMIYKFVNYEQRNPPTDAGFYDHPLMACGWQTTRWFQLCTEIIRGFLINELGKSPARQYNIYNGTPTIGCAWSTATNTSDVVNYFGSAGLGYIPDTNPYNSSWWNSGSTAGINNDINSGAFIVQHRDHGDFDGWGEPDYTLPDLSGLNNTMLPFVFSINCRTGRFDYVSEVFTEAFHRMQYGALGLIAASEVSYSFVNDTYIFGLYDGMWPFFDPGNIFSSQQDTFVVNLRPGFASVSGKYYLQASSWPYNTGDKAITYNLFHTHCDAFITLYSEIPDSFDVTHDATVPLGPSSFTVTVREDDGITIVDSALVCCWCEVDKAMWVRGHTNNFGEVTLNINPSLPVDSIWVTVTKYNHFRYEGCVRLAAGCPSPPTVFNLFNYARDFVLQPTLTFASTDDEGDEIEYEVSWDTDPGFSTPSTSTTVLYGSGVVVSFTFPSPLIDGETYYWRVRGKDPLGSDYWGGFSETRSFTIGTVLPELSCSWYQTKGEQFSHDAMIDVAVVGDAVILLTEGGTITDTLLEEDFESVGVPSGWTVINGNGDGYEWIVGTTGDLSSYTPPSYGSYYAYYSDDDAGDGVINNNEELITSPIFVPDNTDSLFIQYGYGFRVWENGETYEVKVRFLNGSWGGWITIATYTSSTSGTATIDLSSYLPTDSVKFEWMYHDETASSHWGYACAVDNVYLIRKTNLLNTDGKITGTPVIFDELDSVYSRSFWGNVIWDKSHSNDSISAQLEYLSGGAWALVPDGILPGNSSGFFTTGASGVLSIDVLNPAIYDTIRLVANLYRPSSRASQNPSLLAWEIGNLSELSIYLTEFSATGLKGKVRIYWRTESEIDNVCWIVEKTPDVNDEWEQIGSVDGQGTKPTPTEYLFFDENMGKDGKYYYRLISIDREGEKSIFGPVSVIVLGNIPRVYALHDIYPNPFCGRLEIRYDIPEYSAVDLRVYNSAGQVVNTLINGKVEPGYHRVVWNGKNDMGNNVGNGIYFLRMDTDDFIKTSKVILIK
ncbi:T9SS type A sorting domain-containing protein [candidate division WOR-3 bacterium]|nr:T9SS type A sorting domain-containing protein [candidate division WOR-3 bacterium]